MIPEPAPPATAKTPANEAHAPAADIRIGGDAGLAKIAA
jgi:hypothetical protein